LVLAVESHPKREKQNLEKKGEGEKKKSSPRKGLSFLGGFQVNKEKKKKNETT